MMCQAINTRGRRGFLWIVFLGLCYCAHTAVAATLKLTNSTDPAFQQRLDSLFPGVSDLPDYVQLQPFLLIVDNPSNDSVTAYSIEWLVTTPGGHHEYSTHYVSEHLPSVKSAAIGPHQTRLISPFFNNDADDLKDTLQGMGTLPPVHFPGPSEQPFSVIAQVDGEVVNEAQFSGANKHGLLELYQAKRAAQYREALLMQEALDHGYDAQAIQRILQTQIKAAQQRTAVHSVELGRIALAEEAQTMLSLLASGTMDDFRWRVSTLIQRRPPSLKTNIPRNVAP
jgi:hypothetical protein